MTSTRKPGPRTANPRAPLALAAVSFGIGVWLAGHLHRPAWLWGVAAGALIACVLGALAVRSIRLAYIAVISGLICAGAFSRIWMPEPQLSFPPEKFLAGAQVEIIAHVTNDG